MRVSGSEATSASLRFGVLQIVAIVARQLRAARVDLRFRDLGPAADGVVPPRRSPARFPRAAAVSLRRRDAAGVEARAHPARDGAGADPDRRRARAVRAAPHVGEAASHRRVPADRGADVQRQPLSDRDQPVVRGQGGARREGADRHRLAGALQRAGPDRRRSPERAGGNADRGDQAGDRQAARVARSASRACATRPTWSSRSCRPSTCRATGCAECRSSCSANPETYRASVYSRAERRPERGVRRHHGAHRRARTSPSRRRSPISGAWTTARRSCSASTRSGARPDRTPPASSRSCRGFRPRASAIARATCRRGSTT